jgi:2-octaprenyl-6-methoxyphenol hydroxylase
MSHDIDYDLIIVGGGMVGATLAIALKNSPLKIALIEAYEFNTQQQFSYDDRGIALAYGSQRILETMDLWPQLSAFCTPIKHIHVSDRGQFGVTRLHADQEQVPALGQVITAKHLGNVLYKELATQTNLTMHCPARVIAIENTVNSVNLQLADNTTLSTKLVVAADGADSTLRQLSNLGEHNVDYQQTAITANVSTERPHNNWAFERFTDTGPVALLPMSDNRCSLVWTVKSGDEHALHEADETLFLSQLQQRFGFRLGHFTKVGQRNSYPLHLRQADQPIQQRLVFIGNAAHSLHPIAGQGFNLGLRDVVALADVIHEHTDDCGDARALTDYRSWQLTDQDNVVTATGVLVDLFSNANPVLAHARGAGLALMEAMPTMKHWLARKSMGLSGKQPRLARGIKL